MRSQPGFVVEVDAMPGAYVCSASLTAALKPGDTREVIKGERPIRKLFSKAQRAFYEAHAPAGLALDDLSILGPDLRPEAEVGARAVRPAAGRRGVAVPGLDR